MSKVPALIENGKFKPNEVSLLVDNKFMFGWEDVTFEKDLLSLANTVSVKIMVKTDQSTSPWALLNTKSVKAFIGKDYVFNGWFEKFQSSLGSRSSTIAGRSLAGDLVDCDIVKAKQYLSSSILKIVQDICKPFGISVKGDEYSNKIESGFSVKTGENAFNAIDRICKPNQLLFRTLPDGNIELFSIGSKRSKTSLKHGVNVKSGDFTDDTTGRFSEVIVKSQGELVASVEGKSKDHSIDRYRPKVIISESPVDASGAQKRAQREVKMRLAQGQGISVMAYDWRQEDGSLWDVGLIVPFESEYLGLKTELMISKITFSKSPSSGTTSSFTLISKDSLDMKNKDAKKGDDLLSKIKSRIKKDA